MGSHDTAGGSLDLRTLSGDFMIRVSIIVNTLTQTQTTDITERGTTTNK